MDLKEEDILGDAILNHWYYVSKGRAVRSCLGDTLVTEVLDVGAGSGVFSKQLIVAGVAKSAVCVDPNYATERTEIYNGKSIHFVRGVTTVSQKLILMMDVLEHVDDDIALLKEYTAMAKPGTTILITVPAFKFLWSGHDVFLEHKRRYTRTEVEAMAARAGLRVVKARYFFGLLFPIVATSRILNRIRTTEPKSDLKRYPYWLNRLLVALHTLERVILFPFNTIAGLSVVCICERP